MSDFTPLPPQQPAESINFREYYFVIRRRLRLIALIFVLTVAGGILYTRHQTPLYKASLNLLIEPQTRKVVDFNDMAASTGKEYLNTQVKMLKSYALAEKVYRASGLANDPEFKNSSDPPAKIMRMVDVTLGRESWLVTVSLVGPNPKKATLLANVLGETFIREKIDDKVLASREAFSWLLESVEELRGKVQESEKALADYKKKEKDVLLGDRKIILEDRLRELNTRFLDTRRERIDSETLIDAIERYRKEGQKNLATVPVVAQDPRIGPLQKEYFDLETELIKLSRRYKPQHPEILKLQGQLDNLKVRIDREINNLVSTVEIDYQIKLNREQAYDGMLNELKDQAMSVEDKESQYSILEQEAKSNRELFDVLLLRLKETKLTENIPTNNIRIVDRAKQPTAPFTPVFRVNLLLSIMLGLMLGVGLAFALEYIDDSIKTPEDIEAITPAPFLGLIPKLSLDQQRSEYHTVLEPYRALGTNIDIEFRPRGVRRILVTSCEPSEGKTTTVKNLGYCLARTGKQVLEVDADMRKPNLYKILGVAGQPGLTELLTSSPNGNWKDLILTTSDANIRFLPAGAHHRESADLIHAAYLKKLFDQSVDGNDYVLVDSPPLNVAADSLILASNLDAVLLVVRHGKTTKRALKAALKDLGRLQNLPVGIVLNCVDLERDNYYYYGNYYRSYYSSYYAKKPYGDKESTRSGAHSADPVL